ncbi:pseudaminic acid cytidylyltransferase [Laribacter hongkongensis]|uniref:pseudaminic acid cytidylyltransferase n=1 Tax=Laribacter hongkongensis TaxID=168471 RepID=UPI001EFE410F|nr:pseudaminic acid cytidylyltransferase [Laribacter hongkongensis]MCG9101362.1 pseudaminic acid cytidylyltransferase [Laribacter hongkongensis]MCG9104076.1 pseudaminic acid cytidylyltransferase [Laribacter hongkongensis]MCG9113448.1 pseudaminic acid cytidylyltransferase [Laribacter hongkongensis]MCG9118912.1 pseudaminic acid cytidylyltransferase [Laribacter hongkongensis]
MNIAIIPARGGSKRIPRKNIKNFFGKPMIAWSIETARSSEMFDQIIVSTDDPEIADVARQWGAKVPFMRPANLSGDKTGATAVIAHATAWAIDNGMELEGVCCLLATAPFVKVGDLEAGWKLFATGKWDFVFSATDFASPIFRAFKLQTKGGIEMFFPENFHVRSQDLSLALHDAGQFYWGKPTAWLEERRVFGESSTVIHVPRWRVQDIDTTEDWERAELLADIITQRGI